MKYIPDIIKAIVTEMQETQTVYYQFANWREVCIDLAEKAKSKFAQDMRYPFVLLHNDFSEEYDSITARRVTVPSLKIYIVCQSDNKSSTNDRFENYYKLVLYPLYDLLLEKMKQNNHVRKMVNRLEHTKKDLYRLYVGDSQNRLPDFLEGIEIEFSNISFNIINCN